MTCNGVDRLLEIKSRCGDKLYNDIRGLIVEVVKGLVDVLDSANRTGVEFTRNVEVFYDDTSLRNACKDEASNKVYVNFAGMRQGLEDTLISLMHELIHNIVGKVCFGGDLSRRFDVYKRLLEKYGYEDHPEEVACCIVSNEILNDIFSARLFACFYDWDALVRAVDDAIYFALEGECGKAEELLKYARDRVGEVLSCIRDKVVGEIARRYIEKICRAVETYL